MKVDKISQIYFSPTHSSARIADFIVEGAVLPRGLEVDLTYEPANRKEFLENDFVVISLPVYAGRVPEVALQRMSNISGNNTPAIVVVVYGNRDYEDALIELRDWAISHGFVPVSAAAFVGEHSYSRRHKPIAAGRPDEDDRKIALHFGSKIARIVNGIGDITELPILEVRGNIPYLDRRSLPAQTPITKDYLCTQCEYCIEVCPTQAIVLQDEIVSDVNLCIKCCVCVKECPNEARMFETPFTDVLFKNFSARREPDCFYAKGS